MGTAEAAPETKPDPSGRPRARKIVAVAVTAVLGISAAGYAAGKGLISPHRTDRIDEPFSDYGAATYGIKAAPGDELIFLDFFQGQQVDDVITIEQISAGVDSPEWTGVDPTIGDQYLRHSSPTSLSALLPSALIGFQTYLGDVSRGERIAITGYERTDRLGAVQAGFG